MKSNDQNIVKIGEVAEAEASDEVAAIYSDIRKTMAMPFVNLIWRSLGQSPEGIRWTWETMKPLYSHDAIYAEAAALRDTQKLPPVPELPASALRAVGIDAQGERAIRAALSGYDRGNPLNLVSFSAVLARLRNDAKACASSVAIDGTIVEADVLDAMRTPTPPAPPMQPFDEMDETVSELVQAINVIGAPDLARLVRVSLPRNLAHWPGFLSLYYTALKPLHDDGRLLSAVNSVLNEGQVRGVRLVPLLGDTGVPSNDVGAFVTGVIETLVPHAAGRMIPVVSLLQRLLPESNDQ